MSEFIRKHTENYIDKQSVDSSILAIQLEIALYCIENKGIMHEFNQFRVSNKQLSLWQAIEEYSFMYSEVVERETNLARSISLPTSQ